MFDPNAYDPYVYGEAPPSGGGINTYVEMAKAKLPTIASVVILLVLAYLAYDYFAGSVRTIDIDVVDREGKPISNALVEVYESGNPKPIAPSGLNEYRLRGPTLLSSGEYTVRATNSAFEPGEKDLSVTEDKSIEIRLIKRNNVNARFTTSFPTTLYAGESQTVNLELDNSGTGSAIIELVAENGLADNALTIQFGADNRLQALPKTQTQFEALVSVDPAFKPPVAGKKITGKLRIKGTNDYVETMDGKTEITLTLVGVPNITLSPQAPQNLKAGSADGKITIKIDASKTPYAIQNPQLIVDVISATPLTGFTDASEAADIQNEWIRFTELPENDATPNRLTIDSIASKGTPTKELRISVPVNAKPQTIDMIARLVLSGGVEITKAFSMKVATEATSVVTAAFDTPTVTFRQTDSTAKYPKLTITNKNPFQIQDVYFTITNKNTCNEEYLQVNDDSQYPGGSIGNLARQGSTGDKATIIFQATKPLNAETGQTECRVKTQYLDPISGNDYLEIENTLVIKITS